VALFAILIVVALLAVFGVAGVAILVVMLSKGSSSTPPAISPSREPRDFGDPPSGS